MAGKIFLYATHPTLVDHESQMLHNLGFDVYTAAWATNTRSKWNSSDIRYNGLHFYDGNCSFLSEYDKKILSHIEVEMLGSLAVKEVRDVLLDNFDILYVSQVTPWLMHYAESFLNAGKIVLFRTFGYPLSAWGYPDNYKDLYKYSKFYILPTDQKEIDIKVFGNYPRVRHIMASVCKELFPVSPITTDNKFALTVLQTTRAGENVIRNIIDPIIPIKIINRQVGFIRQDIYNDWFNSCTVYLDFIENLLRYSTFEAICYGKPILVLRNKDMYNFMFNTKLRCPIDCYYGGLEDTTKLKWFIDNPVYLDYLTSCQGEWFNERIEEMKLGWKNLFEEIL